jgi:uncharacterized membrane protein
MVFRILDSSLLSPPSISTDEFLFVLVSIWRGFARVQCLASVSLSRLVLEVICSALLSVSRCSRLLALDLKAARRVGIGKDW